LTSVNLRSIIYTTQQINLNYFHYNRPNKKNQEKSKKEVKKLRKSSRGAKATPTTIYLQEDVMQAIDLYLQQREKEFGGRHSRNGFCVDAIMAKVEEYGLLKETKPSTA